MSLKRCPARVLHERHQENCTAEQHGLTLQVIPDRRQNQFRRPPHDTPTGVHLHRPSGPGWGPEMGTQKRQKSGDSRWDTHCDCPFGCPLIFGVFMSPFLGPTRALPTVVPGLKNVMSAGLFFSVSGANFLRLALLLLRVNKQMSCT